MTPEELKKKQAFLQSMYGSADSGIEASGKRKKRRKKKNEQRDLDTAANSEGPQSLGSQVYVAGNMAIWDDDDDDSVMKRNALAAKRQAKQDDIIEEAKRRAWDAEKNKIKEFQARKDSQWSAVQDHGGNEDGKSRHDSDAEDASPPRRRPRHDSDAEDASPPRRRPRHDSDAEDMSPPRRRRHDSDAEDASPPRRQPRRDSDAEDTSPPRRRPRNDSDAEDMSPPRRRRHDSDAEDASPPRRRRHDSDAEDASPPRRRRHDSDAEDASPPRRRPRHDSDAEDISPPRRRRYDTEDASPPNQDQIEMKSSKQRADIDLSPPRKPTSAGLRTADMLSEDMRKYRDARSQRFVDMDVAQSGKDAKTIHRDKYGRKIDLEEEKRKKEIETEKERERERKYAAWRGGMVQVQKRIARKREMDMEKDKAFARTKDDKDMNDMLKEKEHWDDPTRKWLKPKKTKKSSRPEYQGFAPPNRFGIRPGYRWDGVERSNGFEKRYFKAKNNKSVIKEMAYKYRSEDM